MSGDETKVGLKKPSKEKLPKEPKIQLTKEEKALQKAARQAAKDSDKQDKAEKAKSLKEEKNAKAKALKEEKALKAQALKEEKALKAQASKEAKPPKPVKEKAPKPKLNFKDILKKLNPKSIWKKLKELFFKIPGTSKLLEPKEAGPITNDRVNFLSSIKVKLFVAFLVPIILFIITGILIYSKCSNTLIKNSETSTYTTLSTLNEYFESGFEAASLIATRLSINETVCNAYSKGATTTLANDAKVVVSNEATADYLVAYITIIGPNQDTASSKGVLSGEAYQAFADSEAGQIVAASENKITWIGSHPEMDEILGYETSDYALSGVMPFTDRFNKPAGYIIIDIKSEYVGDILANANFGDGSIVGLVNSDGSENTHGKDEFAFFEQEFYQTALASGEAGSKDQKFDGTDYSYVYTPVESTGGMVCALVPKDNILAGVKTIQVYLMVAIVICAVFALGLGNLISNNIAKAIKLVNKTLKQTSSGDLTSTLNLNRKDEFKALSFNLTNMIGSMKKLIQKMTHVSSALTESAGTVNDNAQLLFDVTKNITEAVSFIDEGITQQSTDTESCLDQMLDLATKINTVQSNVSEIDSITTTTQTAVNDGMVIVTDLSSHVSDTTNITKEIIEEINVLNHDTLAINEIIETIEDIAEETDLLSLNASIEAARAGEAGRGFAVVADNIRKFADRSNEAASEIRKIVGALQNRMANTIETANKASEIVAHQEVSLNSTINIFSQIKDRVDTLSSDLKSINASIEGMEQAKNDTTLAIESIAAASNETEASAGELRKSIERQLHSVEELNEAVSHLQENAMDLDISVSIFKIE